jgi:hypothetical protein
MPKTLRILQQRWMETGCVSVMIKAAGLFTSLMKNARQGNTN